MIELPDQFRAGTTFEVRQTFTAYPADAGWSIQAFVRGVSVINLTSVADGVTHVISAPATVTAAWAPGTYFWSGVLVNGAQRIDQGEGRMIVLPDLSAQVAGYDGRTHSEKTLDAIQAVIEKRASLDQLRFQIGNRSLERMSIGELFKLRDKYRQEVASERRKLKGVGLFNQNVRVQF